MTRYALWSVSLALALGLATSASAGSRTYFGFQIGIANAPPPPVLVFHEDPECDYVPSTRVYVVENPYDYDMFRYGGYYYVCDDGYWFRAHSYRGPFVVVDARHVPRPVYYVPEGRWKHYWRDERYEHDRGWHGRGHKHGHDDDDDDNQD